MNTRLIHARHVVVALALAAAGVPLATVAASGSQGGADDHKVTLCHRTNSEHNPYVVITIDKAGVFQLGHSGHDEGGVFQPGDKANGVRWGDIIPPFDYFASPQDQKANTVSHYAGLNFGADGQAVLANGCQVPTTVTTTPPPPTPTPPSGSLTTACTATGALVDIGTLSSGSTTGGHFELVVSGAAQTVTSGQQDIAVAAGATLALNFVKGGDTTALASATAPAACPTTTTPGPPPGGGAGVLPETAVKGEKAGRTPSAGARQGPAAGAGPRSGPAVQGAETGALPRTGPGPQTPLLLALAVSLLLIGSGLVTGSVIVGRRS